MGWDGGGTPLMVSLCHQREEGVPMWHHSCCLHDPRRGGGPSVGSCCPHDPRRDGGPQVAPFILSPCHQDGGWGGPSVGSCCPRDPRRDGGPHVALLMVPLCHEGVPMRHRSCCFHVTRRDGGPSVGSCCPHDPRRDGGSPYGTAHTVPMSLEGTEVPIWHRSC